MNEKEIVFQRQYIISILPIFLLDGQSITLRWILSPSLKGN